MFFFGLSRLPLTGKRYFSSGKFLLLLHKHGSVRNTLNTINQLYETKTPISMITSHDFITAKFAEAADIDINLIGDSLAMVALGYEDTNEILFDEFLYHVKAVSRGNKTSLLIADLPFGSYEISPDQAVESAIKMIQKGRVQGIKLEGGQEMVPTVSRIVQAGIPVMGHVGLTPQRHNSHSGFKLQGNTVESAYSIYQDCLALQEAGVFSIVLECVPNKIAEIITSNLKVPTIGIGAGPHCSGHVLVIADLLGMNGSKDEKKLKFVKEYMNLYDSAVDSLKQYKSDMKTGMYPDPETHGFKVKKDVLAEFRLKI